MQIEQLMSRPVHSCDVSDTLQRAAQLMWEHDCGTVPVVGPDGALVGMITDRDICMAAYTQGAPLASIPVSGAMAREVFSCRADDSIALAQRLMSEKRIRRIPIIDEDRRLVGLLSLNDVARDAASRKDERGFVVVQTIATISEPRHSSMELAHGSPLVRQAAMGA